MTPHNTSCVAHWVRIGSSEFKKCLLYVVTDHFLMTLYICRAGWTEYKLTTNSGEKKKKKKKPFEDIIIL